MTDTTNSANWKVDAYRRDTLRLGPRDGWIEPMDREEEFVTVEKLFEPSPLQPALDKAMKLFAVKNAQYGNAIEQTGVLGAIVALTGDVARLRVLALQNTGEWDEGNIRDKLLDVLVQAAIGVMMVDSKNWRGK
jgi:hypothetical protein